MWPKVTNKQHHNSNNTSTDDNDDDTTAPRTQTSMNSLITWNISKALEKNPNMDLKSALERAQREMESRPGAEISAMSSQTAEERHLFCALLAWHQLGHRNADSLTEFAESKQNKEHNREDNTDENENSNSEESESSISAYEKYYPAGRFFARQGNSKIVMHAHTQPMSTRNCQDTETGVKISNTKSTEDLRKRAALLASREAKRAELLERAETAWRDLELGYERRLRFAEEKEDMLTKQIPLVIKERDSYKNCCNTLVDKLKEVSELVSNDRGDLKDWETKVFDLACLRHSLASEASKADAKLQEQQCKAAQMDRDFQLKLNQVKRNVAAVKSDLEAALLLRQDTEKGFRTELGNLKIQVQEVSKHLLQDNADNLLLKKKLAEIQQKKKTQQEDLETLIQNCDGGVKRQLGQLQTKRRQLVEEQARVVDCRCKLPVDANVEAKRTPSFVVCRCNTFEGKFSESCSCTSLRSKLLSDLFSDLFSGLQEELGGTESLMPCQMLNCLNENHNWDRAGVVKTNLHKFFSKLLLGELDIAIATSIEKYRAKWVGATCEDEGGLCRELFRTQNQTWEKQDVERRALALAQQFAENLLQKQADILKGKNIEPESSKTQKAKDGSAVLTKSQGTAGLPTLWRSTQNGFTQLRMETPPTKEVLKKADPKKSLAQRAVGPDGRKIGLNKGSESREINNVKVILNKTYAADQIEKFADFNKVKSLVRLNQPNSTFMKYERKPVKNYVKNKQLASKICNKAGQTYAVNVCLCEDENYFNNNNTQEFCNKSKPSLHKNSEKVIHVPLQVPSIKQTKPITPFSLPDKNNANSTFFNKSCHCFNKKPSTSSIDKLLETLIKWKYDGFPPLKLKKSKSNIYCNEPLLHDEKSVTKNIKDTLTARKKIQTKQPKDIIVQTKLDFEEKYTTSLQNPIMNEFNEYSKDTSNRISNEKQLNQFCKKNKVNSQSTEHSIQTVPVSRSEYMGAINFDKSYCNCVHQENDLIEQTSDCSSKYGFKCINDDVCNCKDANEKIQDIKIIQNSSRFDGCYCDAKCPDITYTKCSHIMSLNNTCKNDHNAVVCPENNSNCKNDTHIIIEKKSNENICKKKDFDIPCQDNTYQTACHCSNRFEELKLYIDNLLANKKLGMIEDKALDVQSFNGICPVGDKPRVFCAIKDMIKSKEIEINAFALLKEHLREKLEEIKISTKLLPCVIKEDEEKLVSSILYKIKQVISQSTKGNICQCKDSLETKGSWERAYALLQEYLKNKIKRVQCGCASTAYENNILPNILGKVCSMIENDFERLRNINKSNNSVHVPKYKTEIPEKDENCLKRHQQKECSVNNKNIKEKRNPLSEKKSDTNNYTSKKVSFGTGAYIYQNTSSQVSRNYFTKTTSCDPIAMCLKLQEYQLQNYKEIEAVTKDVKVATGVSYERDKILGGPYSETFGKNQEPLQGQDNEEVMIPERLKLIKDDEILSISKIPYVGCTVACSCDPSLGACVCTKAAINNDKIKKIWADFVTINNKQYEYIMKKALNKTNEEQTVTDTNNKENISLKKDSQYRINSGASTMATSEDETLVLKDSKTCNLRIEHNATDVELTNIKQKQRESQSNLENVVSQVLLNVPCCPNDCKTNLIKVSDVVSKTESQNNNCDCKMIPICLVKMLVENIENNLANSKCVCDSMDSKVCPVHSKNTSSVCKNY